MVQKAVAFAAKAHEGVFRKGTRIPYIVHPLETAVIVSMITDDPEVIEAAVLHDVVEDAGVTGEELERIFGKRVADLVLEESEDKTKTWEERKANTIRHLKTAPMDQKIVTLGDKLSNIRSTANEYMLIGDEIWKRFNVTDKKMHAWYYLGIADALKEMENCPYYQEYVRLCHRVFGE